MGGIYKVGVDTKVFTTGMVAHICRVGQHTACKWFDSGELQGYRIPSGQRGKSGTDRRVLRSKLLSFMKKHGMPLDRLPGGEHGGGRVLAVGLSPVAISALSRVVGEDGQLVQVWAVDAEFEAGVAVGEFPPDVAVVNTAAVDASFANRLRAIPGCEDLPVYALGGEYLEATTAERWVASGYTKVAARVADIAADVGDWRAVQQATIAARNKPLASKKQMAAKQKRKAGPTGAQRAV